MDTGMDNGLGPVGRGDMPPVAESQMAGGCIIQVMYTSLYRQPCPLWPTEEDMGYDGILVIITYDSILLMNNIPTSY